MNDVVGRKVEMFCRGDGCPAELRSFVEAVFLRGYRSGFLAARRRKSLITKTGLALLDDFIQKCCIISPEGSVKASLLYESFLRWQGPHDDTEMMSVTRLGRLLSRQFDRTKSNGVMVYHGIALQSADEQPATEAVTGIAGQDRPEVVSGISGS